MPAALLFLDRDGATPIFSYDFGEQLAGQNQLARKLGVQNLGDRVVGGSPFTGAILQRQAVGTGDGIDQLRIGLDTATLTAPYGLAAALGMASDGGAWSDIGPQFWKVTALNAIGETIGSAEIGLTIDDVTKRVTLTWTAVTGASGYRIWRSTTTGVYGPTALRATLGATTTYEDDGDTLSTGTIPAVNTSGGWTLGATLGLASDGGAWSGTGVQYWRVVAIDATGVEICATLQVSATVDDVTKRVTLSWAAVAAAAGYLVYRSTVSETFLTALRATLGVTTSYIDDGEAVGAGDHTSGPSYGVPVTVSVTALSLGAIPIGKQLFFWVQRLIPAPTPETGNPRLATVRVVEV